MMLQDGFCVCLENTDGHRDGEHHSVGLVRGTEEHGDENHIRYNSQNEDECDSAQTSFLHWCLVDARVGATRELNHPDADVDEM